MKNIIFVHYYLPIQLDYKKDKGTLIYRLGIYLP